MHHLKPTLFNTLSTCICSVMIFTSAFFALSACNSMQHAQLKQLKTSADDFHQQMRFSRFRAAANHIAPNWRSRWLKTYLSQKNNLKIAGFELNGIEKCPTAGCHLTGVKEENTRQTKTDVKSDNPPELCAITQSHLEWYLQEDGNLRIQSIFSKWCLSKSENRWFIVEQAESENTSR